MNTKKNGLYNKQAIFRSMGKIPLAKAWVLAGLLFAFSLFIISTTALAVNLSFNDSNWGFYDNDYSDDTGYTVNSASSLSITAGGNDLWTSTDHYAAYWLNDINGDFEITVKITSQTDSWGWQKAGLMVRDDITSPADSDSDGYFIVAATRDHGYAVQYDQYNNDGDNDGNGMLDTSIEEGSVSYPCWLKLKKKNKKITGYYSTDGSSWEEIANNNFTSPNNSANTIQDVGIFVSAVNIYSGDMLTVEFEDFTTNNGPITTTHTITTSVGSNGSISPTGSVEVSDTNDQTFTVTPGTGYQVDTFVVDDASASLTDNQYTFSNVTSDHTISATFSAITSTITATVGENGSISPSGYVTVSYNGSQTFSVTPDEGYQVDEVFVDGSAATLTNDEYTFSSVTSDHTISVTFTAISSEPSTTTTIAGCSTNTTTNYNSGFDASHFDLTNASVSSGTITLDTGSAAIDPESIVIPFEQEVSITFFYEGAGYVSDFGYMLKEDAVDTNGDFLGWENIPADAKHPIFHNIYDDDETGDCCGGGNGILDADYGNGSFPTSSETSLASYDDGTGLLFTVDGDGSVTPKDMKKTLGTFAAGTELVFFLTADKDWSTTDTSGVFFTKKDWNPDTYGACSPIGSSTFSKVYNLGTATAEGGCDPDDGWLTQTAINRMSSTFGITLSGTYNLPITVGQKYAHVIVGAPSDDPNQWILGWEDLMGAGDADHNDMVFRIDRRTGGVAQLKTSQAIAPADADAYFTAVTFEVWDSIPCTSDASITYYVSIDNGSNWVEITDWDKIHQSDASKSIGSEVTDWTPGTPQYTYRSRRIDFTGRDLFGRALIWKAEILSEDTNCAPAVLDVALEGSVSTNGTFARAEPVVVANVIYSGSYETPALSWNEKVQRGHLTATRLYDPSDPSTTSTSQLWDAGSVLNSTAPSARTIYFPDITSGVTVEVLATGDSGTTTFAGTLGHYPVSATTLSITDQNETFTDKHTDELEGNKGGTGTINRFTGAYTITFDTAPGSGVPITATYTYYSTSSTLKAFTTTNVTSSMLGLDDTYVIPDGFTYDFSGDSKYNNVDSSGSGTADDSDGDWLVNWIRGYSDGSSTQKEWLLGPIDHSVPSVATPPGRPAWYYGSDTTASDKADYDAYKSTYADRQTVIYVGARDGMLHAFDGGKFRWGDNPDTTTITEKRGYFLWEGSPKAPNYGTGEELWAFIPANLISRLKNNNLSGEDRAYVDASPALADVYINGGWKTVLLSAEGNGGDTVFALDVTNPTSPTFLWEFSDPDLFRSRSSPAVAKIGRIQVSGSTKWVAFFVSGKTYDSTLYPSIYMIDISDGSVLQRIYLNAESAGVGGVPSGQPAIVDSDENGYIDRIYIGTDKGYLYKVNIPDNPDDLEYSVSHCVINTDFEDPDGDSVPSAQQYHPIYASPAVILDKDRTSTGEIDNKVKIFFGTGDSPYYDEDINFADTTYYAFAYVDEDEKGECGGNVSLDGFFELPSGHRTFASAFVAAGNVYFGTSSAETEDPCEVSNEGRIIAISLSDGSVVLNQEVGNITTSPVVSDQHLYLRTPAGLTSFGGGQYNNDITMGGTTEISTRMWRELY